MIHYYLLGFDVNIFSYTYIVAVLFTAFAIHFAAINSIFGYKTNAYKRIAVIVVLIAK